LTLLVAGYRQSELNSLNLMLAEMETSRAAARAKEVEQADAAHIATMQADVSRRERYQLKRSTLPKLSWQTKRS